LRAGSYQPFDRGRPVVDGATSHSHMVALIGLERCDGSHGKEIKGRSKCGCPCWSLDCS
jgi:hypothetical protein